MVKTMVSFRVSLKKSNESIEEQKTWFESPMFQKLISLDFSFEIHVNQRSPGISKNLRKKNRYFRPAAQNHLTEVHLQRCHLHSVGEHNSKVTMVYGTTTYSNL